MNMETKDLVKEIHAAFDAAGESLLEASDVFFIQYEEKRNALAVEQATGKSKFLEELESLEIPGKGRVRQLEKLGFTGVAEVAKFRQMEAKASEKRRPILEEMDMEDERYNRLLKELEKEKDERERAICYKKKYPFLKFITEKQLDSLCKKYSLCYAPVENYTGSVPQKNLDEILASYNSVKEEDFYEPQTMMSGSGYSCRDSNRGAHVSYSIRKSEYDELEEKYGAMIADRILCDREGIIYRTLRFVSYIGIIDEEKRDSLYIACDESLLNTDGQTKRGFKFVKNPDPIVFRYVKGGVLIISKWGDEANDPELAVPELN